MRIMGLDYGTTTVGVAISDTMLITAQEVETITRKQANKLRRTYSRIEELIKEYGVDRIVLGYPKNMNNTEGERAEDTKLFQEALERRTKLPVILWDERLTTVESERILTQCGVRKANQKKVIDQVAAAIILQSYLDSLQQG
ncbi:MAG: Holliday junction resolvase RuvX [Lachnospira sp.]|nr:Holliday junction resolvase RuvX [Lachnospira sp.]